MKKPSTIGKQHLVNVHEALINLLESKNIEQYDEPVQKTALYIVRKFPRIKNVKIKYEFSNPDNEPDLKIIMENKETVCINLFSLKGNGKIQPKNLGARSFIQKYFHFEKIQNRFNELLEQEYKQFLQSVIEVNEEVNTYDTVPLLKKKVNRLYPSFTESINPIRTSFLFNLREHLFELLQQGNTSESDGIQQGFKKLMLLDSINIITRYYDKNKCSVVEEWQPNVNLDENIEFYKKGNDTVGIRMGQAALTLRFKFESAPTSSLKLATSYDVFPVVDERKLLNRQSLTKFQKLIQKNSYSIASNDSNAVGKCNEALVYANFIEKFPYVYQVDHHEFIAMYDTFASKVKEQTMLYLQNASEITVDQIGQYLTENYGEYEIESIQLVPQSYIKNRLDTADLQLILNVKDKKITVDFSLKAAAKAGSQITMKNPGIGTILGAEYFAVGIMSDVVERVKSQFLDGILNHQQSLEDVSKELGSRLSTAQQANLRKGLTALFGTAPTVVTFYETKQCVIKEHGKITSTIHVLPETPTAINTTLKWNEGQDQIKLRVKFSGGQSKGWSSLKLAGEYRVG